MPSQRGGSWSVCRSSASNDWSAIQVTGTFEDTQKLFRSIFDSRQTRVKLCELITDGLRLGIGWRSHTDQRVELTLDLLESGLILSLHLRLLSLRMTESCGTSLFQPAFEPRRLDGWCS